MDGGGDHEGEEGFVFFKEASNNVAVSIFGKAVDQVLKTLVKGGGLGGLVHCGLVYLLDVLEGVLVHAVDKGEVFNDEEEDGSSGGNRRVLDTNLPDFHLQFFALSHFLLDL